MSHKNAYREVMRDLQVSRERAEAVHLVQVEEAYKKSPKLREIDKRLSEIGLSLSRLMLCGDMGGVEKAREKAAALRSERLSLLAKNRKLSPKPAYACADCSDTGYLPQDVGLPAIACTCLKQRLIEKYYSLSNMYGVLKEENFDSFDISLFGGEIIEAEGLSPRTNMEKIHRNAVGFVQKFDEVFQNLLLYGEAGLGKTFISHCIAKDLLDAGKTVLYLTVPRLCKVIEDSRFNREALAAPDEMLEAVDEVDLLILDDLGAEISTLITSAALFDIINQRLLARKPTVISTNLTPNALAAQYSERIVSRFLGNYQMLKFFGEDIRVKKKYGGLRM
ncbi:MAG: ATP-binding protein [Defluviitaleaceae bacterium]|nr:ATP-binding protein [Defluviitaleaceae bacterium]